MCFNGISVIIQTQQDSPKIDKNVIESSGMYQMESKPFSEKE
jgi:hypothetical protein